jgi:hypothetical protein
VKTIPTLAEPMPAGGAVDMSYPLSHIRFLDLSRIVIYCSISEFGQECPKRDHAAYGLMVQAMGALVSVTGERDEVPGGGPSKVGIPKVEIMTDIYAAGGVLAAVVRREQAGEGDDFDVRGHARRPGRLPGKPGHELPDLRLYAHAQGRQAPGMQRQGVIACRGACLGSPVGTRGQVSRRCDALDRPDLATGERCATNADGFGTSTPCWPNSPGRSGSRAWRRGSSNSRRARFCVGKISQVISQLLFRQATRGFDRSPPLLEERVAESLRERGIDQC